MTNNSIIQYSLSFTEEEEQDLILFLKDSDYSANKEGIKELIMDLIYEEDEEKPDAKEPPKENRLKSFLRENPQAIEQVGQSILNGIKYWNSKHK